MSYGWLRMSESASESEGKGNNNAKIEGGDGLMFWEKKLLAWHGLVWREERGTRIMLTRRYCM